MKLLVKYHYRIILGSWKNGLMFPILPPTLFKSELFMTFFRYKSVLLVLKVALLLFSIRLFEIYDVHADEMPQAQTSLEEEEVQEKELISSTLYFESAALGSIVGFGVGNRMNGTPLRGNFYAVVDTFGWLGLGVGLSKFHFGEISDPDEALQWFVFTASSLTLLTGSRVIQFFDLWILPINRIATKDTDNDKSVALIPVFNSNQSGFQLVGRF
jgi:hypothetical protein